MLIFSAVAHRHIDRETRATVQFHTCKTQCWVLLLRASCYVTPVSSSSNTFWLLGNTAGYVDLSPTARGCPLRYIKTSKNITLIRLHEKDKTPQTVKLGLNETDTRGQAASGRAHGRHVINQHDSGRLNGVEPCNA